MWHEYNSASESDYCKVKGQRRNQLRVVEQKHRAKGHAHKAGTLACEDLSASMKSAPYRHKDTNCRLHGWVKGVMADTLTSISRRRGSALALVNPAYTSQIDSRTGLLQGTRRRDRFYCLDGVVLDADTNAACNILARLYDEEITLYMPHGEVKSLLAERTRQLVGAARPGLELRGRATEPPSTESESSAPGTGMYQGKEHGFLHQPLSTHGHSLHKRQCGRQGTRSPFTQGTSALAGDANSSMELK